MFLGSCIYAQSADVVTNILNTDQVTYGQICYLSAVRQNLMEDTKSYDDAIAILSKEKQLPFAGIVSENQIISLKEIAYIYSKIWDNQISSRGLMYKLTKGSPRYAFKQLKADGIIMNNSDPFKGIDGFEALGILTSCMLEYGTSEECMTMDLEF